MEAHKRIKVLSKLLANQIAAGEVIERPASIVKEIIENSLDAGATHLNIHLERGGKQLIKIQDNGSGIHPDDLELAFSRHATSKILAQADLAQIQTLGFRGEALASIASVAKLTITSKHGDYPAKMATAAGRDMQVEIKPAAHPPGSTIEVKSLFFNTPARKKFLKSERTEFLHVEEIIKRLALARSDIAIDFYHDQKLVKRYVASKGNQETRVQAVLSKPFLDAALAVDCAITQLRLQGWVGKPEFARSSNDYQFFYVNGRMVRDKVINHAVRSAYENKIYPGRFPAYVLYLSCDPAAVDVNVHPTKHEVRFRDSRFVHDFIAQTVAESLESVLHTSEPNVGAALYAAHGSHEMRPLQQDACEPNAGVLHRSAREPAFTQSIQLPRIDPVKYDETNVGAALYAAHGSHEMRPLQQDACEPNAGVLHRSTRPQTQAPQHPFGETLTLLANKVLVTQKDDTLFAIDWQRTLINFAKTSWQEAIDIKTIPLTPLLLPITLPEQYYGAYTEALQNLGFEIQTVGPEQSMLRAIPRVLQGLDTQTAMQDLIDSKPKELQQHFALHWARAHSTSLRDIARTLQDCFALLDKEGIRHKQYPADILL
jgi:DNA mismatch repair protein MutL